MGGFKRKKKGVKEPGVPRPRTDRDDQHYKNKNQIVKENKHFEEFYRTQKVFPEDEIPTFLDALRRPLPQTFRFAGYKQAAKILVKRIEIAQNFIYYLSKSQMVFVAILFLWNKISYTRLTT